MTITDAVKKIIELKGLDIFKNLKQFLAFLDDLAPEYQKERKIIKNNFDENILGLFIDESKRPNQRLRWVQIKLDDVGLAKDWADFIIESFGLAFGWENELQDLKVNAPILNNAPKANPQQQTVNPNVQDVTLNDDVLKQWGFNDKNLIPTVLNIPSTYKTLFGITYRIIKIGNEVFKDCDKLQSVTIPDTVKEIGDSAFENCKSLEKINIPDSVNKIGKRAFVNCKILNSITLPNAVTEIGDLAFADCEALNSVIIPNTVKYIGEEVFSGCINLQQFTLPTRFTIFKKKKKKKSVALTIKVQSHSTESSSFSNSFVSAKIGDYVKFGSYPQTADAQNQPIEWQVLSIENNKMLVISRYGLDAKRFDSSSNNWANSEIRQWLNNEFYNKAFTDQEKKYIKFSNLSDVGTTDNIFLLSLNEAKKYFANNNARLCNATEYAKANGANLWNDFSWWWIRSSYYASYVYYVNYGGNFNYYDVFDVRGVVRPALWINL